VNSHITLTLTNTHPQPKDREISREARQAGNSLASWRTAAPCRKN